MLRKCCIHLLLFEEQMMACSKDDNYFVTDLNTSIFASI